MGGKKERKGKKKKKNDFVALDFTSNYIRNLDTS